MVRTSKRVPRSLCLEHAKGTRSGSWPLPQSRTKKTKYLFRSIGLRQLSFANSITTFREALPALVIVIPALRKTVALKSLQWEKEKVSQSSSQRPGFSVEHWRRSLGMAEQPRLGGEQAMTGPFCGRMLQPEEQRNGKREVHAYACG